MDIDQKSSGLAFNIGFDEKAARPPKSLSLFKNKQDDKEPEETTGDKKQQLADRRRQIFRICAGKHLPLDPFEIPTDPDKTTGNHKKRLPKTSLQARQCTTARKLTAAEELDEKQQRATARRQKRMEEKVRKTREGREALMKLRTNVNIYMQHEKAVEGEAEPEKILSEQDAAYFAHEIAEEFSNIRSRYKNDLERAKGFSMFY